MIYEPMITTGILYKAFIWDTTSFHAHWHNEIEILTCLEGEVLLEIEGEKRVVRAGEVLILPGNEGHRYEQQEVPAKAMVLMLGYSLLGSDYANICNCRLHGPLERCMPSVRMPLQALERCLLELEDGGEVTGENEWFIRGNLFLLAAGLKKWSADYQPSERQLNRAQNLERIFPVLEYIKEHYRQAITVEDAAAVTGYTATYFCRYFKNVVGTSFHQYLNHYRVSIACMVLGDPNLSVAEVSKMAGFSSPKLFCRVFKEVTGVTTSAYRRQPAQEKKMSWINMERKL